MLPHVSFKTKLLQLCPEDLLFHTDTGPGLYPDTLVLACYKIYDTVTRAGTTCFSPYSILL